MWKESYQIGIERIDRQHQELFSLVERLLIIMKEEEAPEHKQEYKAAFAFMKTYVAEHFADEEAYQASIRYSGLGEHQRIHWAFTQTVLSFEERLSASDYAVSDVKNFAGTLVSWLIYHVIREDQKIPKYEHVCIQYFGKGTSEILTQMAGISTVCTTQTALHGKIEGDLFVEIGLIGDIQGSAVFGFPKNLAFALIKAMTFMETTELDEFVCSAMAEISNIISGNAAIQLSKSGMQCDIKPPVITIGSYPTERINGDADAIIIDTGIGRMQVTVVRN